MKTTEQKPKFTATIDSMLDYQLRGTDPFTNEENFNEHVDQTKLIECLIKKNEALKNEIIELKKQIINQIKLNN